MKKLCKFFGYWVHFCDGERCLLTYFYLLTYIERGKPEFLKMHYPLNYNHSINNSKQDRLVMPFYQTKIGVSSLHYQAFKLWNDIPFVLKSKLYTIFAKKSQKTLSNDTCHTVDSR